MPKGEGKVLSELVHSWVDSIDSEEIQREVRRWAKTKIGKVERSSETGC